MIKVIIFIPTAGYRPYPQMVEAYQNAKNYLFKVTKTYEVREFFCKIFPVHANRNACVGHACEGFIDEIKGDRKEDIVRWYPDITIWVDADTVIPYDALHRMLKPDKQIVSGIYKLKKFPHYPMIFNRSVYDEEDDIWLYNPYLEHPENDLFKVDGMVGQGCVRIDTEVLKAVDPPHFQYPLPSKLENPVGLDDLHPGIEFLRKWHVYTNTEESHFWRKVIDKGFEIWVDPKIICKHMREDSV